MSSLFTTCVQKKRQDKMETNFLFQKANIYVSLEIFGLTSSHRMPYKPTNFCWDGRSVSVYTRIPIFVCFAGRLVNTPHMACHHGGWRVYTPSFLGVPGVTVGCPRTKCTASNERVHSFCGFLPNPFIQDLCLWRTSQEFVKTDLYPLSRGLSSLSGMPSVRPGAGR